MTKETENRNCDGIRNKMFAYCEGEFPLSEKTQIDEHLFTCPACQQVFEGFRGVLNQIEAEKNQPADPYFYTRLRARMDQEASIPAEYTPAGLQKIFITAMIAASLGLGIFFGTGIQTKIQNQHSVTDVRNANLLLYADENMITDLNTDQTENILFLK